MTGIFDGVSQAYQADGGIEDLSGIRPKPPSIFHFVTH
jgi:hypothetical protein